jgi:glycerophosphoryl diester phosphodiesterase
VHVFYADTPEDMCAYIEIGVDGILTNYPERLKAVLTEAG